MKNIVLAICIILSATLSAQDSSTVFIAAGRDVSDVLTPKKVYKLPDFVNGRIKFRDGTYSDARLNYNYLYGEIEFIGPDNDTLAIAKNQMLSIREILIDSLTFVYNDGYMELVTKTGLGNLFKKQMYVVVKREKIGGYNQPNPTNGIESYNSYVDNQGIFYTDLKVRENITLAIKTTYFVSDQFNNSFSVANKSSMLSLYRSKRDQVKSYINKNNVDFKNGEDLKKMFKSL